METGSSARKLKPKRLLVTVLSLGLVSLCMLACVLPAYVSLAAVLVVFVVVSLLPPMTFLLLFTTFGNTWLRWGRKLPARERVRFNLPALFIGFTSIAIALAAFRYIQPDCDLTWLWPAWLAMAIPLTVALVIVRYFIDLGEEQSFQQRRNEQQAAPLAITINERPEEKRPDSRWSLRHDEPRQFKYRSIKIVIRGTQAYDEL